jgi:hypothetical protein
MENALLQIIILSLSLSAAGLTGTAAAQVETRQAHVGVIDFFGYTGLDVDKVRSALPVHEGETFPTASALNDMRPRIEEAVRRVTGRPVTEVSLVSSGRDEWLIYVGLSGNNVKGSAYNPAPKGTARLPPEAVDVYMQVDAAFISAMKRGATGDDHSKGYSLSSDDATLRAKQLAMHEYAARHEDVIRVVLRTSADVEQRRIAAEMMGYVNQSRRQIAELVRATHDPDDYVRNNATRALAVLANSDPKVAAQIPAAGFIAMLNSGTWTDRNKAGGLLMALSGWRTPKLLAALRARAFDSLVEMARWHDTGHASSARMMLGRMAGIEERRLFELVYDNAQADFIINAARRRR